MSEILQVHSLQRKVAVITSAAVAVALLLGISGARMAEELEAIRERSQLMREELTDRRAELMDTRGLLISIVALIFLPLTFLTGLLGMNVAGIPFAHAPWAFWGVVLFCIAISAMMAIYFVQTRWTRG